MATTTKKFNITKKDILRTIKEYFVISLGVLFYCFAWIGIVQPAKIVGGGATGMAMLINLVTSNFMDGGVPLWILIIAINAILIIVASIIIGFNFSTKTIFAILTMTLCMWAMPQVVPYNILGLADDRLLSGILAGLIIGAGVSVSFMQGGSTGGTDIIAMIINKYRSVSYGRVIMICDMIIIALSYFINNDVSTVIYSFVVVGVTGYTIDALLAGNRQSTQLLIMSAKYDEIAERISSEANRGVTLLNAEGYYSKKAMKVVMVVTRKSETSTIYRIVKEVDPTAFITAGSVMGVYGQGFDKLKTKKKKN